jgi:PilZ domain
MAMIKCPECKHDFGRRVSRVRLTEKIASLFYVYPFRCQLCGHRFSSFQRGVRYVKIAEDRRDYYRMRIDRPVTFSAEKISGKGTLRDISMGGCSFNTDVDLAFGMILKLEIQISVSSSPLRVDAVVRHVSAGAAGVEFIGWQDSERARLRAFVKNLRLSGADLAAPTIHPLP